MAFVICEPCVGEKRAACVLACPAESIHPTPDESGYQNADQLYIDPDTCTDCGACVEACPVGAIFAEADVPPAWQSYIQKNRDYYNP